MLDVADNTAIQAAINKAITDGAFLSKAEFNGSAAIIRQLKEGQDAMRTNNPMEALVAAGVLEKDPTTGAYKAKAVLGVAAAPLKKDDAVPAWQVQIDQLVSQGKAKDTALAAANTAREAGEMKSAVIAAFEKAGAHNANRDYVHVLPSVKKAADGTYHTIKKDQFGVESTVALDVAFGEFLTGNPELKKAAGKPGSGTPVGSPSTGATPMSTAQYMADRTKNLASGDLKVTF